jgi:hypothetical protein
MSMMPYTPEVVRIIRLAPKTGLGRAVVLAQLGWDDAMFDRVCQRHGIDFGGREAAASVVAAEPATVKTPLSSPAMLRPHRRSPVPTVTRDMTSIMLCVSAGTKEVLQRAASAAHSAVAPIVLAILTDSLASGEAVRCGPYLGPRRGCYVSVAMERSVKAALKQAMTKAGHPNLSAFGAALIERHLSRTAS